MTSGVAIGWRSASVDAIGAAVVLFGLAVSFAAVVGGVSDHRNPLFAIIECRGGAGVLVGGW
jgi:hypothetical protein